MTSTFSKPFDEEFARRCIAFCYPELCFSLERNSLNESPDLFDDETSVGIEVTRATNDEELTFYYEKFKGYEELNLPENVKKKVARKQGKLISVDVNGKQIVKACLYGARELNYCNVIDAIRAKTIKLNKGHYKPLNTYGVFVYNSNAFLWDMGIPEIMDSVDQIQKGNEKVFSIIFIYGAHDIYMIETCNKTIKRKPIKDEIIDEMIRDTLYSIGRKWEYDNKSFFLRDK